MWYIFPQMKGLGLSSTAQYYAIQNHAEAEAYMKHSVLSVRLLEIPEALLNTDSNDASEELKYSMTRSFLSSAKKSIFKRVLDKFFDGKIDERTVDLFKDN